MSEYREEMSYAGAWLEDDIPFKGKDIIMTTELLPELKSCPFCGGEAALVYAAMHNFVNCVDCSATTNLLFAEHRTTEEEATEAWNTRHD